MMATPQKIEREWYTTREVSARTGVAVFTLNTWAREGRIPPVFLAGARKRLWHRNFVLHPVPTAVPLATPEQDHAA